MGQRLVTIVTLGQIMIGPLGFSVFGLPQHLAWGIECIVAQCTDTPNFNFAIKQGGLEKTLEVYNSLIAQLA